MLIDCETCIARDVACRDCVITVLLGAQHDPVDLDEDERAAIGSLAEAGLVPPLRLVPMLTDRNRGIA
jgi:hypothetical protein